MSDLLPDMPDLRYAVLKELRRRRWSKYQLVQSLKGKRKDKTNVPQATIYQFLAGSSTINSADLGLIFQVLNLRVVTRDRKGE